VWTIYEDVYEMLRKNFSTLVVREKYWFFSHFPFNHARNHIFSFRQIESIGKLMDLQINFTSQIDEIQKRLRECNFECNRLKDLVVSSLPELITAKEKSVVEDRTRLRQIADLQRQLAELRKQAPEAVAAPQPEVEVSPLPPVVVADVTVPDEPFDPFAVDIPTPEVSVSANIPPVPVVTVSANIPPVTNSVSATVPPVRQEQPAPKAKTQNPASAPGKNLPKSKEGLEDFIGGNLLNKIGIGILIIGIGIFVKYAIDKDWIGPIGRVLVGLLCGGILTGLAHKLRNSYKSFSSVLLGGGIVVFYFSVAIAHHLYGLFGQEAAFALMCGITGATVFFSIAYNRQEIAVLALLGSFATPFLVSNGEGNYVVLFSYLLIVNIGMLVLAWFKDWTLVRLLGYGLTVLLFLGWLAREFTLHDGVVPNGALPFALLFFTTFFMTTLAYRVRKQQVADALTYVVLLSNSVIFYGASMLVVHQIQGGAFMGLFTALMGAFHFAFILPLRKLLKVQDHLQTLLVGLVLSFLTLAVPIQLSGNYITLFWAAEAVLVLLIAQRTRLNLLYYGSVLVSILAVGMLVWHWSNSYIRLYSDAAGPSPFLLNGAFLTSLLTVGAIIGLHFIHRSGEQRKIQLDGLSKVYQFVALPLLYLAVLFEVTNWLENESAGAITIGVSTFTGLYLTGMMVWAIRSKQVVFGNVVAVLSLVTLMVWSAMQVGLLNEMRELYLNGYALGAGFPTHVLGFGAVLLMMGISFYHVQRQTNLQGDMGKILIWGSSILALVLLSLELDHVFGMMGLNASTAHKVGYPILWGLSGFAMIALGMQRKLLALRIGGLALFLLILLKLFIFDIRSVSPGGKIAAFISLGVLLLVISFMYQRLRKLLTDKEDAVSENSQQ
jgi:uncharacterized membrane protein